MNCPICNGTGIVRESHGCGGAPEEIVCECRDDDTCTCDDCGRVTPLGDCRDIGGELWLYADCTERNDREVERSRLEDLLGDIPPFMRGMPIELD